MYLIVVLIYTNDWNCLEDYFNPRCLSYTRRLSLKACRWRNSENNRTNGSCGHSGVELDIYHLHWRSHTGFLCGFDLIPIKRIEAWLFLRLKRESDACLSLREFVIGFIFFIGGFQMIFDEKRLYQSSSNSRFHRERILGLLSRSKTTWSILRSPLVANLTASILKSRINCLCLSIMEHLLFRSACGNILYVLWSCPRSHRLENYRLIYKRVKIEYTEAEN